MDLLEAVIRLVGVVLGWPLRLFKRWLDRQPDRAPSQISTLHKIGRLAFGVVPTLGCPGPDGMADLQIEIMPAPVSTRRVSRRGGWDRRRYCNGRRPRTGHFQLPLLNEP